MRRTHLNSLVDPGRATCGLPSPLYRTDQYKLATCRACRKIVQQERVPHSKAEEEWQRGVDDAIRTVESRIRTARALGFLPAYMAALDEVLVFLRAMRERGEYGSRCAVD